MAFRDRFEAGQILAEKLTSYRDRDDILILALPRGGVPVAFEVSKALHAPLDVFVVRKLGLPGHEELAMGAIASGGVIVFNRSVIEQFDVSAIAMKGVVDQERRRLEQREQRYRGNRAAPHVDGRNVIVIDDGLATGATMRAAVEALRQQHPQRIIIAVPVGAPSTCEELKSEADDVVCVITPDHFYAVGMWYEEFKQTSDEDVKTLLAEAEKWSPLSQASS